MKRLLGLLALVMLTGSLAVAQSPVNKAAPPTKDEATLIALERQWCEAYKQRDIKTLAHLLADDFIFTSDEGQVQNKAQYLDSVLKDQVTAYTLEDVRARAGAPYHPGCTRWPENGEYNYRPGQHELRLFWRSPSPLEIAAVNDWPCRTMPGCTMLTRHGNSMSFTPIGTNWVLPNAVGWGFGPVEKR